VAAAEQSAGILADTSTVGPIAAGSLVVGCRSMAVATGTVVAGKGSVVVGGSVVVVALPGDVEAPAGRATDHPGGGRHPQAAGGIGGGGDRPGAAVYGHRRVAGGGPGGEDVAVAGDQPQAPSAGGGDRGSDQTAGGGHVHGGQTGGPDGGDIAPRAVASHRPRPPPALTAAVTEPVRYVACADARRLAGAEGVDPSVGGHDDQAGAARRGGHRGHRAGPVVGAHRREPGGPPDARHPPVGGHDPVAAGNGSAGDAHNRPGPAVDRRGAHEPGGPGGPSRRGGEGEIRGDDQGDDGGAAYADANGGGEAT